MKDNKSVSIWNCSFWTNKIFPSMWTRRIYLLFSEKMDNVTYLQSILNPIPFDIHRFRAKTMPQINGKWMGVPKMTFITYIHWQYISLKIQLIWSTITMYSVHKLTWTIIWSANWSWRCRLCVRWHCCRDQVPSCAQPLLSPWSHGCGHPSWLRPCRHWRVIRIECKRRVVGKLRDVPSAIVHVITFSLIIKNPNDCHRKKTNCHYSNQEKNSTLNQKISIDSVYTFVQTQHLH